MASRFRGSAFNHIEEQKVGVLITNLGTPDAPTPSALRRYLKEFLSDPRVVEIPRLIWLLILHLIILRIRPAKSAKTYASVWTDQGSPLAFHTRDQADKLRQQLQAQHGDNLVVDYAMRYGNPSITSAITSLCDQGVRKLLVLPLYPQYSGSTTASTFDAVAKDFASRRWLPELRFVNHYNSHPDYINALVNSIRAHWAKHGRAQKLVLSYHGVPQFYLHKGDPYHCECLATTRLIVEALELSPEDYITTFQSRFGKAEWLKPYTDATLKELAANGTKSVQVICPGFAADCLETLEEIEEENREYFMEAGGERYEYIPALNSSDEHIQTLSNIVNTHIQGWTIQPTGCTERQQTLQARSEQAKRCPHNKPRA